MTRGFDMPLTVNDHSTHPSTICRQRSPDSAVNDHLNSDTLSSTKWPSNSGLFSVSLRTAQVTRGHPIDVVGDLEVDPGLAQVCLVELDRDAVLGPNDHRSDVGLTEPVTVSVGVKARFRSVVVWVTVTSGTVDRMRRTPARTSAKRWALAGSRATIIDKALAPASLRRQRYGQHAGGRRQKRRMR